MLIQLIEWLAQIPELLSHGEALRSEINRKRIAFSVIALHQFISRLAENVRLVQHLLVRLKDLKLKKLKDGEGDLIGQRILQAIDEQRYEFQRIEPTLRSLGELGRLHSQTLFDQIGSARRALQSALPRPQAGFVLLPKDFDGAKWLCKWLGPSCRPRSMLQNAMACWVYFDLSGGFYITFDSTSDELKLHSNYLLGELSRLNAAQKIQNTADELAKLIKANFKMDELF